VTFPFTYEASPLSHWTGSSPQPGRGRSDFGLREDRREVVWSRSPDCEVGLARRDRYILAIGVHLACALIAFVDRTDRVRSVFALADTRRS
jgi:hypothetical protein